VGFEPTGARAHNGFQDGAVSVQLSAEAGSWLRFRTLRRGEVRSGRYQVRYQPGRPTIAPDGGCAYGSIPAALAAAQSGDTIQITAVRASLRGPSAE